MVLPILNKGYDIILLLTNKYTKKISLPSGKTTYLAAEWMQVLIDQLDLINWGIPIAIISDRNPKFLSELWTAMHKALDVKLLYSTAYYPQTDGASEWINQTAEIALWFYFHTIGWPEDWPKVLLWVQLLINNTKSTSITKTPNEVVLGFTPNQSLDLLAGSIRLDHKVAQVETKNAISFAQVNFKYHYDWSHQPMNLKVNNFTLLWLHKGYLIPSILGITKKLTQQYVEPFWMLERIGKLVYQLNIPANWRIYNVFTIAQLEPASNPTGNLFNWPRLD